MKLDANDIGVVKHTVNNADVTNIVNLVLMIAGVVAVVIIVVAGIEFALSSGDPQKAAKARNNIIYALAGLVIVMTAFAITNFVIRRI